MPDTDSVAHPAPPAPHELLLAPAATIGADGRVLGWNQAAADRFSMTAGEAVGRHLEELGLPARDPALVRLPVADGGELAVWHAEEPPGDREAMLAKARAIETLAGPVKHELSNPLNALLLFASIVKLEGGVPEGMAGELGEVAEAAARIHRLTTVELELARSRPATPQPLGVASLATEITDLASYLMIDVATSMRIPDTLPDVETDPGNTRLALVLVVLNALRALGAPKARGTLGIAARATADGAGIELAIEDDAPDVPAREERHLFDALPPAGATRAGTDLAVARMLLRRDGGDLRHQRRAGGGNRMILVMPQVGRRDEALRIASLAATRVGQEVEAAFPLPTGAPVPPGTETRVPPTTSDKTATGSAAAALICDDEASIRALLGRVVERAGLRPIEARSGEEALDVLDHEPVLLVIADQNMARMTGTQLYETAVSRQPELATRFVLMSGDASASDLAAFAGAHNLRVLAKPFEISAVTSLVREAIAGPDPCTG